jgi:hypothetical protein
MHSTQFIVALVALLPLLALSEHYKYPVDMPTRRLTLFNEDADQVYVNCYLNTRACWGMRWRFCTKCIGEANMFMGRCYEWRNEEGKRTAPPNCVHRRQ